MRVLRARAQRLAAVKSRHLDVDDAELDTESRGERALSEVDMDGATLVVDLDLVTASPVKHTDGPQQA